MKRIAILGSTGSVGRSALGVISGHKSAFRVVGLTANRNIELLARQAKRFNPRLLALGDISRYGALKKALKDPRKVLKGLDGVSEVASMPDADIIVVALSGASALLPLISAIRAKKTIALANKESVVAAGPIIMGMARSRGAKIVPIDSEHNSIFQCMNEKDKAAVSKIFLMGTGGPLKNVPKNLFEKLKRRQVLAHPVWKMGKKISVDSATMMNKGLEVIEASHLFGVSTSKIEVLLHPEAIIHSMVEFTDGNIIANLFHPDMKVPILYALNYPERSESRIRRLDFSKIKNISFQKPNVENFPALGLCYRMAKKGGTYPACLTGANEEAVRLYLEGKIKFTAIVSVVEKILSRHKNIKNPSLDEILHTDKEAKEEVRKLCSRF